MALGTINLSATLPSYGNKYNEIHLDKETIHVRRNILYLVRKLEYDHHYDNYRCRLIWAGPRNYTLFLYCI